MPNPGKRQDNRLFPTPVVEDIILSELVEISRFSPPGTEWPYPYGTTYQEINKGSQKYAEHKLVLTELVDDEGLWRRFWYAADRSEESQNTYNASILFPFANNPSFYQISRELILPRDSYRPRALGTQDPGNPIAAETEFYLQPDDGDGEVYVSPSGTEAYTLPPSPTPDFSGAVLVAQSMQPLEFDSKISSLYVRVTRIYQKLPGVDDLFPASGTSQTDTGYRVERPLGTSDYFRLTWKLYLPRETADQFKSADYTPCPIPGYENLLLVQETIEASNENNQLSTVTRVYEGNISGQPFPSATAVIYQGAFYPGQMPPDKFVLFKRKVVNTHREQALASVLSPDAPLEETPLPAYSAMESVEVKPDPFSPGLLADKEVSYYTDITIATLYGEQWDNNLRDYVPYTTFVMPAADYPNIGEPAVGTQRDVSPLGTGWVMVTIQSPRETQIEGLSDPFNNLGTSPRNYLDYCQDHWPNVLYALETVFSENGQQIALNYEFRPREYNGPCLCCKQLAWSKTAPLINVNPTLAVQYMDPTSLVIQWPGVISTSIPECLHYNPDWELYDPQPAPGTYVFTGPLGTTYFKAWAPTNFPAWPNFYVKMISVEPYLGGWRLEKLTVQKPNVGNVSA